ncbi:hypothetical protein [Streptomyces chilikensis]|uniref:hypothetical protein n=1 Tax=Streptomyces chilikensis TaxID=1194079 RepID=UPI000A4B1D82|nr:hypothetical protein [Streptomyces chilikensis]
MIWEAGVGDQRAQFAFAEAGTGAAVGELDGRGAVAGDAFAGLGDGLGQGQAFLLVVQGSPARLPLAVPVPWVAVPLA